jgi:hypothetical protein
LYGTTFAHVYPPTWFAKRRLSPAKLTTLTLLTCESTLNEYGFNQVRLRFQDEHPLSGCITGVYQVPERSTQYPHDLACNSEWDVRRHTGNYNSFTCPFPSLLLRSAVCPLCVPDFLRRYIHSLPCHYCFLTHTSTMTCSVSKNSIEEGMEE